MILPPGELHIRYKKQTRKEMSLFTHSSIRHAHVKNRTLNCSQLLIGGKMSRGGSVEHEVMR